MYPKFPFVRIAKELTLLNGEAARAAPLNCAWSIGIARQILVRLAAAVELFINQDGEGANAILDRWKPPAVPNYVQPYVDTYH